MSFKMKIIMTANKARLSIDVYKKEKPSISSSRKN